MSTNPITVVTRSLRSPAARLAQLDVPEPLSSHVSSVESRHGVESVEAYVRFFEQLLDRAPLPTYAEVDIVALLESDEQRDALAALIKRAIPSADSFDDLETMNAMLFRLAGLGCDDAAVVEFVHAGMQHTLNERTGTFQSREKHFNYHDARDALLGCKRIFDAAGKRFFLDRGTLLGCVREGGFIASDYDIDVGIFADEITLDEVKTLFEGTEFELTQDFEFKVGVASPTGVQIDFFLTTRERGYFLSKGFRSIHNWYFTPFELMEYPFLGERFLIPATYEKHLDENYGNWRDPAIFYDLSYNEPCVAYGRGPEAISYLSKRLARALRRGWRYYSAAAANALARSFDLDVTDRLPVGVAPTVAPIDEPAWAPRPIIVVDEFDSYGPRQRRVIESALSLTPDVRLAVIGSDMNDRLTVAGAIDRVTSASGAPVASNQRLDVDALLADGPQAIVLARHLDTMLSSTDVGALLAAGCDVAFFDESTVALGIVDGRIVARSGDVIDEPNISAR
ncbi:hypothetical protein [Ilumatobacter coccineus]|uniref:LicD family protein n=1 Tax=Ilumatobacter coccineus (strain NBRC 103263 / KCTC 29153 / YM16-304) TaxID=1313172 RepID=A0A6C7EDR9_ILUCY|nr:hypothetical protein [Ilumatobacter coccineus]BAN03329.1 hypothetical protein YM304_30150 [Ilumatobacter coccineus YM16-304]